MSYVKQFYAKTGSLSFCTIRFDLLMYMHELEIKEVIFIYIFIIIFYSIFILYYKIIYKNNNYNYAYIYLFIILYKYKDI